MERTTPVGRRWTGMTTVLLALVIGGILGTTAAQGLAAPAPADAKQAAEAEAKKKQAAEAERQRLEAEAKKKREAEAAEAKRKAEEDRRLAAEEAQRKAQEHRKAEAERQRLEQEKRKQAELDRRAADLLQQAKGAFDGRNWQGSIQRYREFLSAFPQRPEVVAARHGLAMAMVENLDKDWSQIANELTQVVNAGGGPDAGRANYWLAVALRFTGEPMLAEAKNAKPEQQKDLLAKANERLGQAAHYFAIAEATLSASVNPKPAPDVQQLPEPLEMAARARAESAEMLARMGRWQSAIDVAKVFVSEPLLARSAQRPVALLALGQSQLELKDYPGAFATLSLLAPFDQPVIGLAARFYIGHVKELTGERPEAVLDYVVVTPQYMNQRRQAEEQLRNREAWRNRPAEQQRLMSLLHSVPDYVSLASLHAAMIQFEYGQYGEALPRFQAFVQHAPKAEQAPMAQLYMGICQAQLKQNECMRTLQSLENHPQLADQATWWMGRFQRSLADPANLGQSQGQWKNALGLFARAAEKAQQIAVTDATAKARHGDILLDQADTMMLLGQFKEAAPIYESLANDAAAPERAEVAFEKWATTLAKSQDVAGTEKVCAAFLAKYPQSMLRASMMFIQAQNLLTQASELAKKPETQAQAKAIQDQAAQRFQIIIEKFPEAPQASASRYGMGMAFYRQGNPKEALKHLAGINDAERTGDLAAASYYQADCLLRTLPESTDDALSAARAAGQMEQAAKLLSLFVTAGELPETPEAMLKLADCYQRTLVLLADQQERQRTLQSARETYDKLLQKYPNHPAFAHAVMNRAQMLAMIGDVGGAINEFNRFRSEPRLAKSDVAPMALVRLSGLMVAQGRAVDAAAMLEKCRAEFEPVLVKDPARATWIASIRYAHGVSLKECGRAKDATAIFEAIVKEFPNRPEASEASLALILVKKDETIKGLKSAWQAVASSPQDKPVDPKLAAALAEASKAVTDIAAALTTHADRIADKSAGSDLHIRTLRDAALTWRSLAEVEIETFRRTRAQESIARLKERMAKAPPVGKSNSVPRAPELKLADVPLQPAEAKARECGNKAFEANADSPLCNEIRMTMIQMHMDRGEADAAIQLLNVAMDKNPPQPEMDRLRIQLGHCLLLKKQPDAAMALATKALEDGNSPLRAAAYLLKGLTFMQMKNWGEAQGIMTRYRSGAEKYQNAGPVTEEGLIRLAQAYVASNAWSESLATSEHLLHKFPHGRFAADALYLKGFSLQQLKQFDRAVEAYTEVTRRTGSDVAARAQLQIGLCRGEQKRWKDAANELLIVPVTYDYADVAANSSLEAAKALVQLKQPADAKAVLQHVVTEHAGTQWAQEAQKQLKEIQ